MQRGGKQGTDLQAEKRGMMGHPLTEDPSSPVTVSRQTTADEEPA
jgi:hypothetical protein